MLPGGDLCIAAIETNVKCMETLLHAARNCNICNSNDPACQIGHSTVYYPCKFQPRTSKGFWDMWLYIPIDLALERFSNRYNSKFTFGPGYWLFFLDVGPNAGPMLWIWAKSGCRRGQKIEKTVFQTINMRITQNFDFTQNGDLYHLVDRGRLPLVSSL